MVKEKDGEKKMTVAELVEQLQKVEDEDAEVFLYDSDDIRHKLGCAILERDLLDDEFVVVLKK